MRLQAIVDIVKGELLNSPSITYCSKIRLNPQKVEREDLFIAFSTSDIIQAIDNGAYAIITEENGSFVDLEVGIIKVDSVSVAINALFRYLVVSKAIETIKVKPIQYDLLENFIRDPRYVFVSRDNFLKVFEKLSISDTPRCFFFYEDSFASSIFPNFFFFRGRDRTKVKYLKTSLFYTDFEYEGEFYNFEILELFTCELLEVIGFLETRKIDFKLRENLSMSSLQIVYIDKFNKETKKGKSERVLLFVFDENEDVFSYIQKEAKWGKVFHSLVQTKEELITDLKEKDYNFYVIYKKRAEEILKCIEKQKMVELPLF